MERLIAVDHGHWAGGGGCCSDSRRALATLGDIRSAHKSCEGTGPPNPNHAAPSLKDGGMWHASYRECLYFTPMIVVFVCLDFAPLLLSLHGQR